MICCSRTIASRRCPKTPSRASPSSSFCVLLWNEKKAETLTYLIFLTVTWRGMKSPLFTRKPSRASQHLRISTWETMFFPSCPNRGWGPCSTWRPSTTQNLESFPDQTPFHASRRLSCRMPTIAAHFCLWWRCPRRGKPPRFRKLCSFPPTPSLTWLCGTTAWWISGPKCVSAQTRNSYCTCFLW